MAGSTAFRLAALAFIVYQANLRSISSADTFPTRYLPISILTRGNLHLDQFLFLRDKPFRAPGAPASALPYYLQFRDGHYLSTYPIMPAILATPVYAIPVLLGLTGDPSAPPPAGGGPTRTEIVGTLLSKIAASLGIALSVALVYYALRRLTTSSGALWIALAYAFGTSSWSVSSQGMWQTSMSQPLLAGALLALVVAAGHRSARAMVVVAGALIALAVACRPPAIVFAAPLVLYVFRYHRRYLPAFAVIPAAIAAFLLAYNISYFGSPTGGYGSNIGGFVLSWSQISTALPGLLVSPNRGLLAFSPVVIPAFVGIAVAFRSGGDALLRHVGVGVLLTIAFYACYTVWDGAFSYSYRFLVDLLPAMALLAAPTWAWLSRRRWRRWTIGVLAAFSVGVQVVGVFYYPCGWYRSPRSDPQAMARFFDWTDLEVVQCLRTGPVYPDGLRALRDGIGGRH